MDTKEKLVKIKRVLSNNIGKKVLITIRRGKEEYVETKGVINEVFTSFLELWFSKFFFYKKTCVITQVFV